MVYLVRHPCVLNNNFCYGRLDLELKAGWQEQVMSKIIDYDFKVVIHSGLIRTKDPAKFIANKLKLPIIEEPRILERNFGTWEGLKWEEIYLTTGSAMDGLMSLDWAPPGGESNHEVLTRSDKWLIETKLRYSGNVLAITHGGVIAILRGDYAKIEVSKWHNLVPSYLEGVWF